MLRPRTQKPLQNATVANRRGVRNLASLASSVLFLALFCPPQLSPRHTTLVPGGSSNSSSGRLEDSAAVPEVLRLFLQQPSVADNSSTAVFKLLTTSKAMQAAIGDTLTGRLSLAYSSKDPKERNYWDISKREKGQESFLAWLHQHGHLLRSLHIQDMVFGLDNPLAAALHDAAASPKGLHLQSYDSDWDDSNSLAVLKALPAHSLTHLRICITEPMPDDDGGWGQVEIFDEEDECAMEEFMFEMQEEGLQYIRTKHDNPPFAAALAALTNLSSLTIHGYEACVMASLSNLTSLTKLSIQDVLPDSSLLSHLPTQLKELEVDGLGMHRENQPFAFGRLTALTRPHMSGATGWLQPDGVCVGSRDVLPPNLVSLCAGKVAGDSLQPLAGLKGLRNLTLAHLPAANTSSKAVKSTHSQEQQAKAAKQCLPDVVIKVASGATGPQFNCHCHSTTA